MLITTITHFFTTEGHKVEELRLVDAETLAAPSAEQLAEMQETGPALLFVGVFQIPVGIHAPGPDGKPMLIDVRQQDIRFDIEAKTRTEACAKFAEKANEVLVELKKKQEERAKAASQPGIIVPNAAQSEAINKLKLVTE